MTFSFESNWLKIVCELFLRTNRFHLDSIEHSLSTDVLADSADELGVAEVAVAGPECARHGQGIALQWLDSDLIQTEAVHGVVFGLPDAAVPHGEGEEDVGLDDGGKGCEPLLANNIHADFRGSLPGGAPHVEGVTFHGGTSRRGVVAIHFIRTIRTVVCVVTNQNVVNAELGPGGTTE